MDFFNFIYYNNMVINSFKGRWFFLSNFYPSEIKHQGLTYPTVEHFYVAMKSNSDQYLNTKYYTSGDFRDMVSKIKDPGIVKKLGQKIKIRKDWNEKKLEFMNWAVREKFKNLDLSEKLISTGNFILIEENFWHDNFWGQCICDKCKGVGKNHLGKILMEIRNEIKGIKRTGLEQILN